MDGTFIFSECHALCYWALRFQHWSVWEISVGWHEIWQSLQFEWLHL
jgi:hypothetical protein